MDKNLVVYCTSCQMWFDTKNGWKADKANFGHGIPTCPACGSVLMEIDAEKFYENNRKSNRLDEVMTWEWPNGSFWKDKKTKSCWLIEFDNGQKIIIGENLYKQEVERNWAGRKRKYEAHWFDFELCRRKNQGIKVSGV